MWRSFFYALGLGLILLGGEALIFERVELNPRAKLPQFLEYFFSRSGGVFFNPYPFGGVGPDNAVAQSGFGKAGFNSNQPTPSQQLQPFRSTLPAAQASFSEPSRFGPSRFAGSAQGGYGGPRTRFGGNVNGGAGRFPGVPVRQVNSGSSPRSGPRGDGFFSPVVRELLIKDWMPWSLMAVGGVIFLYTHTTGRRYPQ